MTEHQEQVAFFRWLDVHAGRYRELSRAFAIPNGGARHKAVAGKLKAEGVKAGVPDVFLPVPAGFYHGLFIEMKTATGRATKEQRDRLLNLARDGYAVVIARGWIEAARIVVDYLKLPENLKP